MSSHSLAIMKRGDKLALVVPPLPRSAIQPGEFLPERATPGPILYVEVLSHNRDDTTSVKITFGCLISSFRVTNEEIRRMQEAGTVARSMLALANKHRRRQQEPANTW